MKPIALGATVRQIVPKAIEGVVFERRFNDAEGQMEYHIQVGEGEARWFLESQINVLEQPA